MTLHDFIDYCATNKIPAAEITTYFLQPKVTENNLLNLRLHAQNHGVTFSGTAIGNNFSVGKGPLLDEQIAETKERKRGRRLGQRKEKRSELERK